MVATTSAVVQPRLNSSARRSQRLVTSQAAAMPLTFNATSSS